MVNDNGIGFNQKYASKAFGLFQRLHNIEGVAGSGVGLTICKKIVEDNGGLIMAKEKKMWGLYLRLFSRFSPVKCLFAGSIFDGSLLIYLYNY